MGNISNSNFWHTIFQKCLCDYVLGDEIYVWDCFVDYFLCLLFLLFLLLGFDKAFKSFPITANISVCC